MLCVWNSEARQTEQSIVYTLIHTGSSPWVPVVLMAEEEHVGEPVRGDVLGHQSPALRATSVPPTITWGQIG